MYRVSREKTCLPKISSFDARGKNLTFAETFARITCGHRKSGIFLACLKTRSGLRNKLNLNHESHTIDKGHESIRGLLLTEDETHGRLKICGRRNTLVSRLNIMTKHAPVNTLFRARWFPQYCRLQTTAGIGWLAWRLAAKHQVPPGG